MYKCVNSECTGVSTIANDLPVFLAVQAQMMFGALHWWCQLCFLPGRGWWERADPQWCSVWLLELRCRPTETSVEKCSEIAESQKILREARTWSQTTDIITGKVLSPHGTIHLKIKIKIQLKYTSITMWDELMISSYLGSEVVVWGSFSVAWGALLATRSGVAEKDELNVVKEL